MEGEVRIEYLKVNAREIKGVRARLRLVHALDRLRTSALFISAFGDSYGTCKRREREDMRKKASRSNLSR